MKSYTIFLCEDTRTTKKLFNIYQISLLGKHFIPLPQWSDSYKLSQLHTTLTTLNCGVLSEAWTPWLSDPWKMLVQYADQHKIPLEVLPWANALIPAIVATPTDTSSFIFLGFVPAKKWRQTFFKTAIMYHYPVFFFESVHRIEKTLADLAKIWYTGTIRISRELSKKFEEHRDWSAIELLEEIKKWTIQCKGEFVIWLYNKTNQ
jgi:16S rRNA (cytidine1402-2'-O)-methyltransferase